MEYSLNINIAVLVGFIICVLGFAGIIALAVWSLVSSIKNDELPSNKFSSIVAIAVGVVLLVVGSVGIDASVKASGKKLNEDIQLVSMDENSNVFTYKNKGLSYTFNSVTHTGENKYIKLPRHCVVNMQYTSDTIGWAYIEKEPWQNAKISLVIPQNYMTR